MDRDVLVFEHLQLHIRSHRHRSQSINRMLHLSAEIPAQVRFLFNQMNRHTPIGQRQGRVHPTDTTTDHQGGLVDRQGAHLQVRFKLELFDIRFDFPRGP